MISGRRVLGLVALLLWTFGMAAEAGAAPAMYAVRPGECRSPDPGWPPPWGPGSGPLPVLLVSSPGSEPQKTWGGPSGLNADLVRAGYPVFLADLSRETDPDPDVLARVVADAARRTLVATGSDRLHVVAHGLGALAARRWAQEEGAQQVATLIMLGPPNRGSFALNLLRMAAALCAREAGLAGPTGPYPWPYVWEKGRSLYQPLYARYVATYRLGPPGGTWAEKLLRLGGRLPFEGWLAREEPELFAREFLEAQKPAPEGSATLAYQHALALNVGRAEHLRATLRGPGLSSSLLSDPLLSTDWPEMARHYGKKVAWWAGRQLADYLTTQGQKYLLERASELLGLYPLAPGLERVLTEYFEFPLGPDSSGCPSYQTLLGNWYLHELNRKEAAARVDPTPRYVTVAGRTTNLWRLGWKSLGDNDFWTEVESCLLPLAPEDSFHLVAGGLEAAHGSLPRHAKVREVVLEELRLRPGRAFHPRGLVRWWKVGSWEEECRLPVDPWRARHLVVTADRLQGMAGELEVEASAGGQAWVWAGGPAGWQYLPLEMGNDGRARRVVPDFGGAVRQLYVGSRLPLAAKGGLVASYRQRLGREVTCRLTFRPQDGSGSGPGALGGLASGGDGAAKRAGTPGAGTPRAKAASVTSTPQDPPVIHAKLKTKKTTHRQEERIRHERWEWDFGDGITFTDSDATHLVSAVTHTFVQPGQYTVRARSIGTGDCVLRDVEWQVVANAAETPWEGRCETVAEPAVDIDIQAPKEWMCGRPALIRVSARVDGGPFAVAQQVDLDPGREFVVVWERPGEFPVRVAAIVTIRYRFPEGERVVRHVILEEKWVKVLAISGTD